jgi:hypothetical protein
MFISNAGVTTDDGTFLPIAFLEGSAVFNRSLFTADPTRVHFDTEYGVWVDGVFKFNQRLSYRTKNDIDIFYQAFASTGSFTVPSGVTQLYVIVCGAGGAAGNDYFNVSTDGTTTSRNGGRGGDGGLALGVLTVTPGTSITATVGAAVTNSGGGTSSFSTLSATGGTRGGNASSTSNGSSGTAGVGSGGIFRATTSSWNNVFLDYFAHRIPTIYDSYNMYLKRTQSGVNTTSTAVPWSFSGTLRPGAGAPAGSEDDGVGGAIIVFWS